MSVEFFELNFSSPEFNIVNLNDRHYILDNKTGKLLDNITPDYRKYVLDTIRKYFLDPVYFKFWENYDNHVACQLGEKVPPEIYLDVRSDKLWVDEDHWNYDILPSNLHLIDKLDKFLVNYTLNEKQKIEEGPYTLYKDDYFDEKLIDVDLQDGSTIFTVHSSQTIFYKIIYNKGIFNIYMDKSIEEVFDLDYNNVVKHALKLYYTPNVIVNRT